MSDNYILTPQKQFLKYIVKYKSLHRNELVFTASEADLLTLLQSLFPCSIRIAVEPYIMMVMEIRTCHIVSELGIPDRSGLLAQIHACLVDSYRVK